MGYAPPKYAIKYPPPPSGTKVVKICSALDLKLNPANSLDVADVLKGRV
jgi:hypothetical protein